LVGDREAGRKARSSPRNSVVSLALASRDIIIGCTILTTASSSQIGATGKTANATVDDKAARSTTTGDETSSDEVGSGVGQKMNDLKMGARNKGPGGAYHAASVSKSKTVR